MTYSDPYERRCAFDLYEVFRLETPTTPTVSAPYVVVVTRKLTTGCCASRVESKELNERPGHSPIPSKKTAFIVGWLSE